MPTYGRRRASAGALVVLEKFPLLSGPLKYKMGGRLRRGGLSLGDLKRYASAAASTVRRHAPAALAAARHYAPEALKVARVIAPYANKVIRRLGEHDAGLRRTIAQADAAYATAAPFLNDISSSRLALAGPGPAALAMVPHDVPSQGGRLRRMRRGGFSFGDVLGALNTVASSPLVGTLAPLAIRALAAGGSLRRSPAPHLVRAHTQVRNGMVFPVRAHYAAGRGGSAVQSLIAEARPRNRFGQFVRGPTGLGLLAPAGGRLLYSRR